MNQTRIPPPKPVEPNPEDYECEWCNPPKQAQVRVQIKKKNGMPTDQSIYACHDHADRAERLAEAMK